MKASSTSGLLDRVVKRAASQRSRRGRRLGITLRLWRDHPVLIPLQAIRSKFLALSSAQPSAITALRTETAPNSTRPPINENT